MPRPSSRAFFKAYTNGEALLAAATLRGESRRVLSALRAVMDWENWVRTPQRQIARDLGIPWGQFSRGVGELVDHKPPLVFWSDHPSGATLLRVSLWLAWRGRDRARERAERESALDAAMQLYFPELDVEAVQ